MTYYARPSLVSSRDLPTFDLADMPETKIRTVEVRPDEDRPVEACVAEVRTVEARLAQVGPAEVRAAEVRPLEVRFALPPPGIPGSDTL